MFGDGARKAPVTKSQDLDYESSFRLGRARDSTIDPGDTIDVTQYSTESSWGMKWNEPIVPAIASRLGISRHACAQQKQSLPPPPSPLLLCPAILHGNELSTTQKYSAAGKRNLDTVHPNST